MALSDPLSAVVTVELTTRGGTVYRWCHSGQCPSGIVYEDGSTPRYFEPRLIGGVVSEDCGGLLGGYSRPRSGNLIVTLGHRNQMGYDDFGVEFTNDIGGWPKLAGATVVVYVADRPVGGASKTAAGRDRLATGKVLADSAVTLDWLAGTATLPVQWYVVDDTLAIEQTRFSDGDDEVAAGVAGMLAPLHIGAPLGAPLSTVAWLETSGTPTAKRFRAASAVPGLINDMNAPNNVFIGATTLTAQSPKTDPPDAQGKWGSWSSSQCTFTVNDTTGALNIGNAAGQVSRAEVEGYTYNRNGFSTPPTTNTEALTSLLHAADISAATFDIDLTGLVTGVYLYGFVPYPPRAESLLLADALSEAMIRLLCVATTDADGKLRIRYPGAKTAPDHVFYRDAVETVTATINPFGEYANSVDTLFWAEDWVGGDPEDHRQLDEGYAQSVAGMLVAGRDITMFWWQAPGATFGPPAAAQRYSELLFQDAWYITANLGPQALPVRVGDTVAIEWPTGTSSLYDKLTAQAGVMWHVRMREIDLSTLRVRLGILSAAWPGSTATGGGWTFTSVPGGA